ncbi:MAG: WYL domain-containing protein [Gemmatimonadales bacterium]|nr:WYL domain-containing protein [Gemmatimonadales bacterium]
MPSPSTKIRRWVDLLTALLRHTWPVSLEQLREEVPAYRDMPTLQALRRTFERDKAELRELGVPIETVPSEAEAGYRLSRADFYLPYLALLERGRRRAPPRASHSFYAGLPTFDLTPDQLEMIVLAGRRVASLGDPHLADLGAAALRTLAVDLPVEDVAPGGPAAHVARQEAPADTFALVEEALQRRKRLHFLYERVDGRAATARTLHTYGLFFLSGHWYVAGVEPGDDTVKNFRVSRMRDLAVEPRKPAKPDYRIPVAFRLEEHARSREAWELGSGDAMVVDVRFTGEGGAARAAAARGAEVPGAPGVRRFHVRRADAFARWLLSLGGEAVPVAPPEMVGELRALARRTRAAHGA